MILRGLGVGITANEMIKAGVLVDSVEIDSTVYEFAEKYFGFTGKHNKVRTKQIYRNIPLYLVCDGCGNIC